MDERRAALDGRRRRTSSGTLGFADASTPDGSREDSPPVRRTLVPVNRGSLARLRKTLSRHAKDGWQRAVFSRPNVEGRDPDDHVLDEASARPPEPEQIDGLIERAIAQAKEGRVKQTLIVDERTRVRIDARFGKAKVQVLDDATTQKMMGGKDRPLRPDRSGELLRVIGIMNADGTISRKHAKKYKQVNHFVELCRPVWERLGAQRAFTPEAPLCILDLGCGNAYLSFVMAEALRLEDITARLHGIDRRSDVIERAQARARELQFEHVSFSVQTIHSVSEVEALGGGPDVVVALHACDTATDDALRLGVEAGVPALLVAPCCQHELMDQLGDPKRLPVGAIVRHGLLRQDFAATLTDAIRVEWLEAQGYQVDLVEFVTSEHSAKNLLIRATSRPGRRRSDSDLERLEARCRDLGVQPSLLAGATVTSST